MKDSNIHSSKKNSFILFLVWPFFALAYAIRNYRAVWAKDIIWLFVVFYGLTLTIQNTGEDTVDANRYRDKFVAMSKTEMTWENFAGQFYNEEDQNLDILETTIMYVLSRVTGNYHILFALFGLIYGYFYSRNIWYLIEKAGRKINTVNIFIIVTFALIVGFWEINGFRFWSATHIFLFGTLPFLYEGKKNRLWLSLLSVFMHFAYAVPLIILGIFIVAGRRTNIFFGLFIATFFIRELNLTQVGEFLSANLPQVFIPRVKGYTSEGYVEKLADLNLTANWYAVLYRDILKWAITAFIILIFFKGRRFISRYKGFENLFSFTLLLFSVANVFALVPSGGRFLVLADLFSMCLIFLYIQYTPAQQAIKKLMYFAVPAFTIYCIVSIRLAFDTMGIFSVFGNPLLFALMDVDITLIGMIKSLMGIG